MLVKKDTVAPFSGTDKAPAPENPTETPVPAENPSADSWFREIGRWRADATK